MKISKKFLLTKEVISNSLTKESQPHGDWSFKESIAEKRNTLKLIRWQAKWNNVTPKALN